MALHKGFHVKLILLLPMIICFYQIITLHYMLTYLHLLGTDDRPHGQGWRLRGGIVGDGPLLSFRWRGWSCLYFRKISQISIKYKWCSVSHCSCWLLCCVYSSKVRILSEISYYFVSICSDMKA